MAFTDLDDMFKKGYKAVPLMNGGVTAVGTLGAQVLGAKDASELPEGVGGGTAPGNATTTTAGLVKQATTVAAPAAITATADTASTATDAAGAVVDLNDLITKYNALRTDVTALRTTVATLLANQKTAGQVA